MEAEVWVSNLDAGRVRPGASVRLKLTAFPYQRYGMLEGIVRHMSADATERPEPTSAGAIGLYYRALVTLDAASAPAGVDPQRLVSGMQLAAEIHLGTRTLLEYLLSPVRRALHEAGRES
jgi:HlyD family secretion protein